MSHIHLTHANSPGFGVICGIGGCPATYQKYHSFYKHVTSVHKHSYAESNRLERSATSIIGESIDEVAISTINQAERIAESDVVDPDFTAIYGDSHGNSDNTDDDEDFVSQEEVPNMEALVVDAEQKDLRREYAKLLLALKDQHCLPQVAISDIISGFRLMHIKTLENLKALISTQLKTSGVAHETQHIINNCFETWEEPFDDLDTHFKQSKHIANMFNIVEPIEIVLGETLTQRKSGQKLSTRIKYDKFYYFPFLKSIEQLLTNDNLLDILTSGPHYATDNFLVDVYDGSYYKEMQSDGNNVLLVDLYYDDIEVSNPLGTASNKISMFYYSLSNIPVKFMWKPNSIRVLVVAETKFVTEYGMSKILERFCNDVSQLYNGYTFSVKNMDVTFHGGLHCCIGDTPAINSLGGFKEGVGAALDKCRHCQCHMQDMQGQFVECDFELLDESKYLRRCEEIEKAPTAYMKKYFSTLYGINAKSVLCTCPGVDITKILPQDHMHVVLEGVAQYEVKEVLRHFIYGDETMSLMDFNDALKQIMCGIRYDAFTFPKLLPHNIFTTNDNRLRQSSSEMRSLMIILPFVLHKVGCCGDYFDFIVELLELCNIIFSPVLSLGTLSLLQDLISCHLKRFKHLFPHLNVLPKQHYLIHYPSIISTHGPTARYSCMRFEAKHKKYKRIVRARVSTKNTAYSIAQAAKEEECRSSQREESNDFVGNKVVPGKCSVIKCDRLSQVIESLRIFTGYDLTGTKIYQTNFVTINHSKFVCTDTFVAVAVNVSDTIMQFGRLVNIYFVNSTNVFFQVKMYSTKCFNQQFQAYEITEPGMPEGLVMVKPSCLVNHKAYFSISVEEDMYIPIFYDLSDAIDMHAHMHK